MLWLSKYREFRDFDQIATFDNFEQLVQVSKPTLVKMPQKQQQSAATWNLRWENYILTADITQ